MGWSYRKSLKMGPVRFNLSKSGIGTSIGVRGLRVGTSGTGRTYVRAGRRGLLYNSTLSGGRSRRSSSPGGAAGEGAASASGSGAGCLWVLVIVLCLVGAVAGVNALSASGSLGPALALVGVVSLFVAGLFVWSYLKNRRRRLSIANYLGAAQALGANPKPLLSQATELLAMRAALEVQPPDAEAEFAKAYRGAVADVVADQRVTEDEKNRLRVLARGFGLLPAVVAQANLDGFLEGFSALVVDGRLTAEEEASLTDLRESLRVPDAAIEQQLARADELRRARQISEGPLSTIETEVKLRKGEQCYYVADVTEKKSRVARSYVEDGVRYTDREMDTVRAGKIYFSNQRLLFVADGTTTIKLDSILDAATEMVENETLLSVTVDGRKTPYYFAGNEPYVLLAVIENLRAASVA